MPRQPLLLHKSSTDIPDNAAINDGPQPISFQISLITKSLIYEFGRSKQRYGRQTKHFKRLVIKPLFTENNPTIIPYTTTHDKMGADKSKDCESF